MGNEGHGAGDASSSGAPRHAAKPAATPDRRARHYPGVVLLGGEDAEPTELDLDLDGEGVRLSRRGAGTLWSSPWAQVSALTAGDHRLPDGRRGVVVTVTANDGSSRAVAVPARRPGTVAAGIGATARRQRVDPDRPDRRTPSPVVLAVVAVTGALVAWLLLAAGHVVGR